MGDLAVVIHSFEYLSVCVGIDSPAVKTDACTGDKLLVVCS